MEQDGGQPKEKARSEPPPKKQPSKQSAKGTSPFTCHCGKQFKRHEHMSRHQATHSDDIKFTCKICQKSFRRQDVLHRHTLTHNNAPESGEGGLNTRANRRKAALSRAGKACISCQKLKLRCDGKFPCARCAAKPDKQCRYAEDSSCRSSVEKQESGKSRLDSPNLPLVKPSGLTMLGISEGSYHNQGNSSAGPSKLPYTHGDGPSRQPFVLDHPQPQPQSRQSQSGLAYGFSDLERSQQPAWALDDLSNVASQVQVAESEVQQPSAPTGSAQFPFCAQQQHLHQQQQQQQQQQPQQQQQHAPRHWNPVMIASTIPQQNQILTSPPGTWHPQPAPQGSWSVEDDASSQAAKLVQSDRHAQSQPPRNHVSSVGDLGVANVTSQPFGTYVQATGMQQLLNLDWRMPTAVVTSEPSRPIPVLPIGGQDFGEPQSIPGGLEQFIPSSQPAVYPSIGMVRGEPQQQFAVPTPHQSHTLDGQFQPPGWDQTKNQIYDRNQGTRVRANVSERSNLADALAMSGEVANGLRPDHTAQAWPESYVQSFSDLRNAVEYRKDGSGESL
ncbi:hypothetical protein IE53DRAFT_389638 [Violaceomyces palustris]|uniref:Uncharacterized protein n=1 Tax=Violaceomyces palustris TaxID=1673888 RepID=A0ACD0NQX6_9BASI|nr:hypothetical protein IE53DRAFT_389638 [Violaceomyces palustris]